jgi:hypothetical protein
MEMLRIGLGAVISTLVSVGALSFFHRRQKRREATDPHFLETEKRRAQRIITGLGSLIVYAFQMASGLTAAVPACALAIWIGTGTTMPKIEVALLFGAMFVGGWIVFAWCIRITDTLGDKRG